MWNCERDGVDDDSDRRGIGGRPMLGAMLDRDSDTGGNMEETCLDGAETCGDSVTVDVVVRGV